MPPLPCRGRLLIALIFVLSFAVYLLALRVPILRGALGISAGANEADGTTAPARPQDYSAMR